MKKLALSHTLKRKLLLIAAISLLLALALEIYTFGFAAGFLVGCFRAFFVFFVMITLTVLAIIPGVSYGVNRFAGK
ncbi:DUF2798 domain-containing protein [Pontibacter chitinilyticus]|uniref:DUF2798 domain-containing protein n=1 Tax=Pontibacter chitinilyticus TaxID=2674989 RepID=UPI0032194A91